MTSRESQAAAYRDRQRQTATESDRDIQRQAEPEGRYRQLDTS